MRQSMQCIYSNKAHSTPINPDIPLILRFILLQKKRHPFSVRGLRLRPQPSPLDSDKRHKYNTHDKTGDCQEGIDRDGVFLEGPVG